MTPPKAPTGLPGIGRLLSVREVCSLLGIGERTLWTWLALGRLPAVRLTGRTVRIPEAAVLDLIRDATTGT